MSIPLWALLLSMATVSAADQEDRLGQLLDTDQFASAIRFATSTTDVARRDTYLARIAVALADAGAGRASMATAAGISDSDVQSDAHRGIAASGVDPRGGAAQADFQSLIDLIQSTIAPDSWEDVGGPGAINAFPGGVYVDLDGVLRRLTDRPNDAPLVNLRRRVVQGDRPRGDLAHHSELRCVSLPKLERALARRLADGQGPTESMRYLAGLTRIQYVFVYPDTADLVIAGPAGSWQFDDEARVVNAESGRPVVQLDDLIQLIRLLGSHPDAQLGCSITPTEEGLARTQAFLDTSQRQSIRAAQRGEWLETVRAQLGRQEVDVFGIDPRTRAAHVLVEADYRMKLVGMGLEEGVLGVTSYLDLVDVPKGESPPPMDVLRWWFTLDDKTIEASEAHDAFAFRGQAVRVLSENELLTAQGQRIHTGRSDELNQRFTASFTSHFPALAEKYPVYADMQNIFELALLAALLKQEDLPATVGWAMEVFADADRYRVPVGPAPMEVESVINHRVIRRRHIVAGVSGGVRVDPWRFVQREAIQRNRYGKLDAGRASGQPAASEQRWWWD